MWFIGLLAGLILGGIAAQGVGALWGGLLGATIGLMIQNWQRRHNHELETRLQALESTLDALNQRLRRLEISRSTATPVASPTATPVASPHATDVAPPVAAGLNTTPDAEPATRQASAEKAIAPPDLQPPPSSTPPSLTPSQQQPPQSPAYRDPIPQVAVSPSPAESALDRLRPHPSWQDAEKPQAADDGDGDGNGDESISSHNPILAWFMGANTIVRVGILILFMGLGFLVKYAAEHVVLPIELRLAAVAAGAVALLGVGWRLRLNEARREYALSLQGAGIGALYLTVFAAYRLYQLLPGAFTFLLLAGIAVFAALLALRQSAQTLAVIGVAGGFLAPILASSGSGSHVALFSYYLLLNLGLCATTWCRPWRLLNMVGFLFTFVIGLMWGMRYYQPDYFATTEPFLILNALIYIAIAVRYAYQQAPHLTHYAEGMLIFGVPLIGFGLQVALVKDFEYGSAWSSAVLAAFYLLLARWLHARQRESLHLLIESFLALGVIFATLTLPLALDARWTSAAWALEGAGVFWLGMRQQRQLARLFGLLLQILAALALLKPYEAVAVYPLVNAPFLGSLLMALAGWFIHRQIVKPRDDTVASPGEQSLAPLLFLWSLGWWLAAGWGDIERFIDAPHRLTALLAFATATVATFGPLYLRWQWREAAWPFLAFLPTLAILALAMAAAHDHPFAAYGWLVWPLALATHVWLLRKLQPEAPTFYFGLLHSATLLFLAALGAWEMHWLAGQFGPRYSAWSVCSVIGIPCLLLLTACSQRLATRWPLVDYEKSYLQDAGRVILVGLWLWVFYANFSHDGAMPPLPYLPLINVLDLGHILILLTVLKWRQWAKRCDFEVSVGPAPLIAISLASFVWVNAALLRTLHHWAAIPYRFDDLMRSVLVQTSLSIFWTLLALGAMLAGTKKQLRPIWFAGAGLMAVVVGKLFLVDLSNIGGILRIVSFIGVGVLMLVIGYIAPLPPAMTDAANEQERNP